jgi:hypothetical protein
MLQPFLQRTGGTAPLDEQIMSSTGHRESHLTIFVTGRFFGTQHAHNFVYFIMLRNIIYTPLCTIIISVIIIVVCIKSILLHFIFAIWPCICFPECSGFVLCTACNYAPLCCVAICQYISTVPSHKHLIINLVTPSHFRCWTQWEKH